MSEREPTEGGSNFFGDCEYDIARMDWEGPAPVAGPDDQPTSTMATAQILVQPKEISLDDEVSRFESEGGPPSPCD